MNQRYFEENNDSERIQAGMPYRFHVYLLSSAHLAA